jgi:hypothetical protein
MLSTAEDAEDAEEKPGFLLESNRISLCVLSVLRGYIVVSTLS